MNPKASKNPGSQQNPVNPQQREQIENVIENQFPLQQQQQPEASSSGGGKLQQFGISKQNLVVENSEKEKDARDKLSDKLELYGLVKNELKAKLNQLQDNKKLEVREMAQLNAQLYAKIGQLEAKLEQYEKKKVEHGGQQQRKLLVGGSPKVENSLNVDDYSLEENLLKHDMGEVERKWFRNVEKRKYE